MNQFNPPSLSELDRVVQAALAEDAPWGDATCDLLVPADRMARGSIRAREAGVFCGGPLVRSAMRLSCADLLVETLVQDGEPFLAGAELMRIQGPAAPMLTAERVALNLAQRLSGIATATRSFVDAVRGSGARIVDTRKTTPGLRALERYAVRCGGGFNHRFSLSDAVMVKDNHLALLAAQGPDGLTRALSQARRRLPHTVHFEVEVDRVGQIEPVLAAGVDTILLDNFSLTDLAEGVRIVAGRALVEASGNVRLETVREIARTGVDLISSGALTHSVRALDLGFDLENSNLDSGS